MFGGPAGKARMMGQDNIKPRNTRQTLGRLAGYFKPFWYALLVVAVLLVSSTWAQVKIPELLGGAVDCYLVVPSAATGEAGAALPSFLNGASQSGQQRCTLESQPERLTTEERLAGLGRTVLIILALYIFISLASGVQFYFCLLYTSDAADE